MPLCTVCQHPQHLEINQALLSGDVTQQSLCSTYGLSRSAVSRHKDHLMVKMNRARSRLREIREQGSVFVLNEALESARRSIAAAEADNNYLGVFRGANTVGRLVYQIGRLEGTMKLDTLYRLLTSPAWTPGAALMPNDPGLLTGLHQALIDDALISCPDLTAEISAADPECISNVLPPPTANRKPETLSPMARLRLAQNLLPDMDLTLDDVTPDDEPPKKPWKIPFPPIGNQKPPTVFLNDPPAGPQRETTGKPAGNERETSGILAGNEREFSGRAAAKNAATGNKIKQYRQDKRRAKKLPGNPPGAFKAVANIQNFGQEDEVHPACQEVDASLPVFSPATANRKPETIFSYDPFDSDEPEEALDASPEILDDAQAAELAAYLAAFPPYAKTKNSAPDVGWERAAPPTVSASATPSASPEPRTSVLSRARPAPDFLITAYKRPAFLPAASAPGGPSSSATFAPAFCPSGPGSADPQPRVPPLPPPAPGSGRPSELPNFGNPASISK